MADNNEHTFDSLRLLPGQPLQLEFEGYDTNRDRSALVGYQKGRGIMISTPTKQGVPMSVKPKTKLKVRLFVNQINGACAFESQVVHVSIIPFPHLHLTWPAKLFIGEVRKSIRATVHIIASVMVKTEDSKKTLSSVIDDLSTNGARVHGPDLGVTEGNEIDLVFKLEVSGVERILHVKSVVRSAQFNETKNAHFYGLQFIDVSEADTITLHAYVLTQLHKT
jgi:c-di-GMP-binding flagellar brake protein YcgR